MGHVAAPPPHSPVTRTSGCQRGAGVGRETHGETLHARLDVRALAATEPLAGCMLGTQKEEAKADDMPPAAAGPLHV